MMLNNCLLTTNNKFVYVSPKLGIDEHDPCTDRPLSNDYRDGSICSGHIRWSNTTGAQCYFNKQINKW